MHQWRWWWRWEVFFSPEDLRGNERKFISNSEAVIDYERWDVERVAGFCRTLRCRLLRFASSSKSGKRGGNFNMIITQKRLSSQCQLRRFSAAAPVPVWEMGNKWQLGKGKSSSWGAQKQGATRVKRGKFEPSPAGKHVLRGWVMPRRMCRGHKIDDAALFVGLIDSKLGVGELTCDGMVEEIKFFSGGLLNMTKFDCLIRIRLFQFNRCNP